MSAGLFTRTAAAAAAMFFAPDAVAQSPGPAPNGNGKRHGFAASPEFARAPYTITIGEKDEAWKIGIYGFVEFNVMNDSTRSYADSAGAAVLQRDDTIGGQHGRTHFTARNSRLGFKMEAPRYLGIKPGAVIEGDFFGNQPSNVSEASLLISGGFRLRHAYVRLETDYVDVIAGESYALFGQNPYFFPASVQYLPFPNLVLFRTMQVRLSHRFRTDPIDVDVGVAAVRPQRDSAVPEGQAAIRLNFNYAKAVHAPGSGGPVVDPMALGISGLVRSLRVDEFSARPQHVNSATSWGLTFNAMIPLIPAKGDDQKGHGLTLTGALTIGTGIGDQLQTSAGVTFPQLPNPDKQNPAPVYTPDIDNGLVVYDPNGELRTIHWRTFVVGLQYYLPPAGRISLAANYSHGTSVNMPRLIGPSAAKQVYKQSRYFDANVFFDITPAVRTGLSYQLTMQTFVDDATARNHRWMLGVYYFF